MNQAAFSFKATSDGLELHGYYVLPDKPLAIVELVHGMAEHKERYYDFMHFLAEHGYGAYIHDLRGHGESIKEKDDLGYFYELSGQYVVEDVHDLNEYIHSKHPNLPLFLFGHSMGSLIVRNYLQKYDQTIQKLIVCGSPSANPLAKFLIPMLKALAYVKGEHYRPAKLNNLLFKNEGTVPNAWLSYNTANVQEYNADPLDGFIFTVNGFINLMHLLTACYDSKRYAVKNKDLAILMIAGADDPIIVSSAKFEAAASFLKALSYQNLRTKLYAAMRHEILNETDHLRVYQDILTFLAH